MTRQEAGDLQTENTKLRMLLQRVLANFEYLPETRDYRVTEAAWFNQPYMFKQPSEWLRTELAALTPPLDAQTRAPRSPGRDEPLPCSCTCCCTPCNCGAQCQCVDCVGRTPALDAALGLHTEVQVDYEVTGYVARLVDECGRTCAVGVEASTVGGAVEALSAALSNARPASTSAQRE